MNYHNCRRGVALAEKKGRTKTLLLVWAGLSSLAEPMISRSVHVALAALLQLLAVSAAIAVERPKDAELQRLLNLSDMEILDHAEVALTDRHAAKLLIVDSTSWPHAGERQLVLYRRELKKALLLDAASASGIQVLDLDHDGISEVEIQSGFTNQGVTTFGRSLAQISEDKMVVLHTFQEGEDNEGACGDGVPCEQTQVSVEYQDLNSDGVTDIVETVTKVKDGKTTDSKTTKYLFKSGKVIQR